MPPRAVTMVIGKNYRIECLTGSGRMMNLFEVKKKIAYHLARIFLHDASIRRPVCGGTEKLQDNPLKTL
jgi:hypothetical protein